MSEHTELELNSTSNFCLTGRALGSEHGAQDYSGMLNLSGARIVKEKWLLSLVAQRDELLKALELLVEYHVPKVNPLSDAAELSAKAAIAKVKGGAA